VAPFITEDKKMCHVDLPEEEKKPDPVAVIAGISVVMIIAALLVGLLIGEQYGLAVMRKEAVRNDFAMYHPTTGQWMWKNAPSQEPSIPPDPNPRITIRD
jgi:hypothetical protein